MLKPKAAAETTNDNETSISHLMNLDSRMLSQRTICTTLNKELDDWFAHAHTHAPNSHW